jgi:hypothetical protein
MNGQNIDENENGPTAEPEQSHSRLGELAINTWCARREIPISGKDPCWRQTAIGKRESPNGIQFRRYVRPDLNPSQIFSVLANAEQDRGSANVPLQGALLTTCDANQTVSIPLSFSLSSFSMQRIYMLSDSVYWSQSSSPSVRSGSMIAGVSHIARLHVDNQYRLRLTIVSLELRSAVVKRQKSRYDLFMNYNSGG